MGKLAIYLESTKDTTQLQSQLLLGTGRNREALIALANYLKAVASGTEPANEIMAVIGAASSGTLTFTGAPSNNQTFSLGGVTFTAKTSGAGANEFNIGGTVTETAANVAAAVNASVSNGVYGQVVATSSAGVVTFSASNMGVPETVITLTESLSNATVATFTGGSVANQQVFAL